MQSAVRNQIQFRRFDVRPLLTAGVEPLPEVRKRADALAAGQGLAVVCPFLPAPLIEVLGSDGFQSRIERAGVGGWIVYFWRDDT